MWHSLLLNDSHELLTLLLLHLSAGKEAVYVLGCHSPPDPSETQRWGRLPALPLSSTALLCQLLSRFNITQCWARRTPDLPLVLTDKVGVTPPTQRFPGSIPVSGHSNNFCSPGGYHTLTQTVRSVHYSWFNFVIKSSRNIQLL